MKNYARRRRALQEAAAVSSSTVLFLLFVSVISIGSAIMMWISVSALEAQRFNHALDRAKNKTADRATLWTAMWVDFRRIQEEQRYY